MLKWRQSLLPSPKSTWDEVLQIKLGMTRDVFRLLQVLFQIVSERSKSYLNLLPIKAYANLFKKVCVGRNHLLAKLPFKRIIEEVA